MTNKTKYGTLFGVGVGPGDPELITLKAYKTLKMVSVVFIPKKSTTDLSYAYSIIKNIVNIKHQKVTDLLFPMTKDLLHLEKSWKIAADKVYFEITTGKDCAVITEGDPFLYSTFLHLYKTFTNKYPNIPIEVIPGITSINASSCRALFPITERDGKIAILPAIYHINEIKKMITSFDTIVLLKVHSIINKIHLIIEEFGTSINILFVQKCGTVNELIIKDLNSLKNIKPDYLSLMIIKRLK